MSTTMNTDRRESVGSFPVAGPRPRRSRPGRALWLVVGLLVPPGLAGCGGQGGGPAVESGPPTLSSKDELRQRLEYVVSSGMAGSGLAGMPEIISTLDNATALEADYRRLEAAGSPDQIKAIASEMLKKL